MKKVSHPAKIRLLTTGALVLAFMLSIDPGHADFLLPGQQPASPQGQPAASQPLPQGTYQGGQWIEPNALNMFYAPQALQTQQTTPLALACQVVLRPGTDLCNVMEVNPTQHVFRTNDRIRFKVQPNADGYLYIFQKGSDGTTNRLFPHPAFQQNATQVRAYREYVIPVNGWFKFDQNPGVETVYFFLSQSRLNQLETLPAAGQNASAVAMAPQSWNAIAGYVNNGGRNLVLHVDPGQSGTGVHQTPTLYAAQPVSAQNPVMTASIRLSHQP